jgi:2-polyprenyl-6-methoxyphenol hydroxylase-like FAD-dependent oxidoreductase
MEGHTSIWGEDVPRRTVFEDGYGLQVERDRFDGLLLEQSGARVRFGSALNGLIKEDGKVVGARFRGGETRARFVVVATGPGRGFRHLRQSAIYAYWKRSRHPEGSQANDTIIEAFPDGWVWSLRLSSDLRNVTVLFDKPGLSYHEAIAQTSFVRAMLEAAELESRPAGCDASWQCADVFAEPGLLRVGDAGSVIDPLSSQGVYKALCSAITAAAVLNTCLRKPELESAALQYYNDEERRMYDAYAAGAVAMFRVEQRWPERPFWKKRHALATWDIAPRPFSNEIANAIESGRDNDRRLRVAAGVQAARRPTISGHFIEMAEYVVSPRFDYGYRGLHAATILEMYRSFAEPRAIADVLNAGNARDAATLLKIVSYMYKEGLLEVV